MRFVIRADGGPQIGGGHIMRCLTFAQEASRRGHSITFVVGEGPMVDRIRTAGHRVLALPASPHENESFPAHAHWLSTPWDLDAAFTADVISRNGADWLVWDHYGLDARWVDVQRLAKPDLKVLALDDLDDRALGSDLVLDPARMSSNDRANPVPSALEGPRFALLRPEFAALRSASLARRQSDDAPRRVLIAPGLLDAAGLAPMALRAIAGMGLDAEVVMGSASQSIMDVQHLLEGQDNWTLTLDAQDMAQRMLEADLCIGAAGGTTWERCCMGLPTAVVAVADNQLPGIAALERTGAALSLSHVGLRPDLLSALVGKVMEDRKSISSRAAQLCDGKGAERVLGHVENCS